MVEVALKLRLKLGERFLVLYKVDALGLNILRIIKASFRK